MNIEKIRLPIPFSDLIYDRIGTKETYCTEAIFQEKEVMNNNNKFLCKVWYPYLFLRTSTKRKLWMKQSIFFLWKWTIVLPWCIFGDVLYLVFCYIHELILSVILLRNLNRNIILALWFCGNYYQKNKYIIKRDEIHEFHSYCKFLFFARPNRVLCFPCMTNT